MTTRQLVLSPALALVLALPAEVALAQRAHHPQGGRSGGGRGGAFAVPRSSPRSSPGVRHSGPATRSAPGGYSRPGAVRPGGVARPSASVAERRHPRAGTGWGRYGYGYRPYHGRYHGYYGGYHRPYYGYRPYYGGDYYNSWFYGSVSIGWPFYTAWPYYSTWPYSSGGDYYTSYGYAPSYGSEYGPPDDHASGYRAPSRSEVPRGESGQLRLEVRPDDASVYVDDQFRGSARDARILRLAPGRHVVELVRPGYAVERHEVEIVAGERADLFLELRGRG